MWERGQAGRQARSVGEKSGGTEENRVGYGAIGTPRKWKDF